MNLQPVSVRLPDGSLQQIHAMELPEKFDEVITSWDMAFKDLSTSDYVAGGVWAANKADRFLLDQVRERLSFPRTLEAVKSLRAKWPAAHRVLIEEAANGAAVLSSLQHEVSGLIGVHPAGGKVARAQAVSAQIEGGNIYVPHPAIAPWVDAFIEECAQFPNGKNDDQVDEMTQALHRLHAGLPYGLTMYLAAKQAEIQGGVELEERMRETAQRLTRAGVAGAGAGATGDSTRGRARGAAPARAFSRSQHPDGAVDTVQSSGDQPRRRCTGRTESRWDSGSTVD
jgi:predicted phage terminase large subunit-like protein